MCLLNSKREGRDGGGKNEGQKFGVSVVVCVAWAEGKERVNGQREGRMEKEKEGRRKEEGRKEGKAEKPLALLLGLIAFSHCIGWFCVGLGRASSGCRNTVRHFATDTLVMQKCGWCRRK